MGAFSTFSVSGSGLTADRLWMSVIAENLANSQTTVTPQGGPYRRQEVVFAAGETPGTGFSASLSRAMGVRVAAIVPDPSPLPQVYDPSSPQANPQGYVTMPNVNPVKEMTDLVVASQSYNANVSALSTEESTDQAAFKILQGV